VVPTSDKWPDEPDEPDPEARWGDPETDLVSIPSVEAPEPPDPGDPGAGVELDAEVARFFWVSVVAANVAVGGIGIGLLLVGFRGQWTTGGVAVGIGLLALYRTYDIYRRYRAEVDGDAADATVDADAEPTTADTDATVDADAADATADADATVDANDG